MTRARPTRPKPTEAARKALLDRLGYRFRDEGLLDEALTHSSLENLEPGRKHNQRLEFLGDRVIGLVVADHLFGSLSGEREGALTGRYHECVNNRALARVARDLGFGAALEAQSGAGLADTDKVLADALEAVVGAIWRDGGMEAARPVILGILGDAIEGGDGAKDAKTLLQEYALDRKLGLPVYEPVDRKGPDHAPEFTVAARLGEHRAEASGPSKRDAEQAAAAILLGRMP